MLASARNKHICNFKPTPLFSVMTYQCGCGKYRFVSKEIKNVRKPINKRPSKVNP